MSDVYIDILENGYMLEVMHIGERKIYCKSKDDLCQKIKEKI